MLTTDTPINSLHGGNKKVVSPYKSLTGGNTFCKAECDNDPDCNVYSINSTGCFISRCDTYLDIPGCKSCKFASKDPPSSSVDCLQTSALPPFTTMISQLVTTTGNDVTELTTYNLPCVAFVKMLTKPSENQYSIDEANYYWIKLNFSLLWGNWPRLMITGSLQK